MDELLKYYEYLKAEKADVPDTFESFHSTLLDDISARKYYEYLKENQFDVPDTYESFQKTFNLKKKPIPLDSGLAGPQEPGFFAPKDFPGLPPASTEQQPIAEISPTDSVQDKSGEILIDFPERGLTTPTGDLGQSPQIVLPEEEKPGFWTSLGRSAKDIWANQVPQIIPSGRLANRPRNYDELAAQYPTYASLNEEAFEDPRVFDQQFSDKLEATVGADLRTVRQEYPEGGDGAYELFRELTEMRLDDDAAKSEAELSKQQGESEELKKGVVQSRHDINSFKDFRSYIGNLVGQAVGSSSTMLVGGHMGSFLLEMNGAYEDAVRKAMDATGKTREEIESGPGKRALREAANAAGAINSVLEKVSFGVVTAPMKKAIQRMIAKKVTEQVIKRGVTEGIKDTGKAILSESGTEGIQNLVTQMLGNKAVGKPVGDINWDEFTENVIGGAVGGGAIAGFGATVKGVAEKVMTKKAEPAVAPEKPVVAPEEPTVTAPEGDLGKTATKEEFDDATLNLATLDLEDSQVVYPKVEGKVQTTIGGGKNYNLLLLDRKEMPESGPFEISIQDDNGEPIGFIRGTKADKTISINLIHLQEENRGKGIGTDIYEQLLDEGYTIKSDKEITDATYSLYTRLGNNENYERLVYNDGRIGIRRKISSKEETKPLRKAPEDSKEVEQGVPVEVLPDDKSLSVPASQRPSDKEIEWIRSVRVPKEKREQQVKVRFVKNGEVKTVDMPAQMAVMDIRTRAGIKAGPDGVTPMEKLMDCLKGK